MDSAVIGIITGTGMDRFSELVSDFEEVPVDTPFGRRFVQVFEHKGARIVHANRHSAHAPLAEGQWCLPMYLDDEGHEHFLDPRPTVLAIAKFQPRRITSTTAVGTPQDTAVRTIVFPSDHRTPEWGITTLARAGSGPGFHQPKSQVFCEAPQASLVEALHGVKAKAAANGVLQITRGPGFESRADGKVLREARISIVGMHCALPEAYICYELGICYTAGAIITDSLAYHPSQTEIEQIARETGATLFRAFCDLAICDDLPSPCTCQKYPVPDLLEQYLAT